MLCASPADWNLCIAKLSEHENERKTTLSPSNVEQQSRHYTKPATVEGARSRIKFLKSAIWTTHFITQITHRFPIQTRFSHDHSKIHSRSLFRRYSINNKVYHPLERRKKVQKNSWTTAVLSEMCALRTCVCVYAYENLKLTRYRKRCGKNVAIRQKRIISSVGEMLPDLPTDISHEQLHMVYRIAFFSVFSASRAFYCKIK